MSAINAGPSLTERLVKEIDDEMEPVRKKVEGLETELEPLRAQLNQAEDLKARLTGTGRATRAPRASAPTTNGRRSRAGRGTRKDQFLEIIKANPGITVSKAATEMGLEEPNYLYRVKGQLVAGREIEDRDGGLFLVAA